jgi:hypothetical protein
MRHLTRLRRFGALALLPFVLVACGGGSAPKAAQSPLPNAPETALGAAALFQAAGVYQAGQVHVSSGKDLRALQSGGASYAGVVSNVFSPFGDEPAIWQFKSVSTATSAFKGNPAPVTVSAGEFYFRCGSLLVVGDAEAKVTAAQTTLARRFTDCQSVAKVPASSG